MATRVVKPVVLDETVQEVVEKLNGIKDVLDTKTFTPSVLLDNKSITENGVYEAKLDDDVPCDGYAKVTVNVAGGGVDFESLMLKNIAQATVPTSWEIPTTATVIPEASYNNNYYWRNELFDDVTKLTTITLAAGHTGITEIGESAFANFSGLENVTFADGATVKSFAFQNIGITGIPSTLHLNMAGDNVFNQCGQLVSVDGTNINLNGCSATFSDCHELATAVNIALVNGVLPSSTFNNTKVKEPKFQDTVKYLGSSCFGNLQIGEVGDGIFKDTEGKITNEDYMVAEPSPYYTIVTYQGNFYSNIRGFQAGGSDFYFEEQPTLYNMDMSPFVDDPDGWHVVHREGEAGLQWYFDYGTTGGRTEGAECHDPERTTSEDYEQFAYGDAKGYYLPNLKKIGRSMFYSTSVTEFNFPEVTRVASYAFQYCGLTTTIIIPKCEYMCDLSSQMLDNLVKIDLSGVDAVTELEDAFTGARVNDNTIQIKVKNATMVAAFQASNWATFNEGRVEFVTSW